MRNTLIVGALLAVGGGLAVWLSGQLDLGLAPHILLGVAVGAVTVLVADHSLMSRVIGLFGGVVIGLVGYFVRAALLPDTEGGRAVAVFITLALVTVAAAALAGRIPFWALLLGAGTFAGAYEAVYAADPPLVAETAVSTLTALLVALGIGLLVSVLAAPAGLAGVGTSPSVPADRDAPRRSRTTDHRQAPDGADPENTDDKPRGLAAMMKETTR